MSRLLLRGRVLTPGRDLPMATVLVEDRLIEFVAEGVFEPENATPLIEDGDIIGPGFVDLQVNGFAGLPKYGVTAFLPTIISRPLVEATRFVDACAAAEAPGASLLGAHVEGPFINPKYRGAHDPACLSLPEPERVRELLEFPPSRVTLAPELPGVLDAIRELTSAGVGVSAGHSGATMNASPSASRPHRRRRACAPDDALICHSGCGGPIASR